METLLHKPINSLALSEHFAKFRKNIIGIDQEIETPFGKKKVIYADWIASGRLYEPIENKLQKTVGPWVANTHTETSFTGAVMTHAYEKARKIIKKAVNANQDDVLIAYGTGMTGAIIKLQRILGFKIPEKHNDRFTINENERPVVFLTHMEHHSNQTSWLETIATVEIIKNCSKGLVDLNSLADLLEKYKDRELKIASVTGCSNVTGIITPYYQIAEMMHKANGYCFVDFACSGPYVDIDMHPKDNTMAELDAIFLSPHKFLGGPGTPGILVFNKKMYHNKTPDNPGGGTVVWTNPWGFHQYIDDIETREDGGTPGFLQLIKAAMAFQLKDEMGTANIQKREEEQLHYIFSELCNIPTLNILSAENKDRIGAFSFYVDGMNYNLGVKLLNDKYGIQVRGGCSCAGTYGHYLLDIDHEKSSSLVSEINHGNYSIKPGWIRLSLHPVMTDQELQVIALGIKDVVQNFREYEKDYTYIPQSNSFVHKLDSQKEKEIADGFFD